MIQIRLVGPKNELTSVLKDVDTRLFLRFRGPMRGNNPRYNDSDNELCYFEATVDTVSTLFSVFKKYPG